MTDRDRLGTVLWTTVDITAAIPSSSTEHARGGSSAVHAWGNPARADKPVSRDFSGHPQSTGLITTTISFNSPVDGKALL
jgi:hypothetical protein